MRAGQEFLRKTKKQNKQTKAITQRRRRRREGEGGGDRAFRKTTRKK
jgi:hypothetical protein